MHGLLIPAIKSFFYICRVKNAGKIFAALLAFYLLALFVMPCAGDCDSDEHQAYVTQESTQHHAEHENDNCSPFCSCDCCSSILSIVHASQLYAFIPSVEKKFSLETHAFVLAFSDDCWQPPRLA